MTDTDWSYVAGAWDARGGVAITQGVKPDYFGARLWVETLTRSDNLDRAFGAPTRRANYRRDVWRYEATSRTDCARITAHIAPMVSAERRPELDALIAFIAATTPADKTAARDALVAARDATMAAL